MHCSISLKNILISISAVFTVIGSIFLGVLIGLIPLQSCPSFSYGFLIPAIVIIGLFIGFILFLLYILRLKSKLNCFKHKDINQMELSLSKNPQENEIPKNDLNRKIFWKFIILLNTILCCSFVGFGSIVVSSLQTICFNYPIYYLIISLVGVIFCSGFYVFIIIKKLN